MNKSFCMAPWVHTHISPQAIRQICCISELYMGVNKTLEETWNCDDLKEVRRKMLLGEEIPSCYRCFENKANPNTYQHSFNQMFSHLKQSVINQTLEDGTFNGKPISFDYRNNICNLKCKMCWEGSSSLIEIEKTKNGTVIKDILNDDGKLRNLEIVREDFSNDDILNGIVDLYWSGGEPLYSEIHWEMLDKLIEKGLSKNITMRYTTNLTTLSYKGKSFIDYIKHFKSVSLACSLDATGEIGEWIRTNLNYETWKQNFKILNDSKKENKNLSLMIVVTVTTPTIFDLENLYQLFKDYDVSFGFQMCNWWDASSLLTPQSFPKEIVENLFNSFLENHKNENNNIINEFRVFIDFLLSHDFFENLEFYDQQFKVGIDAITYLEKYRPHSTISFEKILKLYPPMYDFYNNQKMKNGE